MLKKIRAVLDLANFLVENVSVGSIEKVVKGRWPLALRRRRMGTERRWGGVRQPLGDLDEAVEI